MGGPWCLGPLLLGWARPFGLTGDGISLRDLAGLRWIVSTSLSCPHLSRVHACMHFHVHAGAPVPVLLHHLPSRSGAPPSSGFG